MRLDVTPLGAASRSVAAVAKAVVDYLEGGLGDPGAGLLTRGWGSGAVLRRLARRTGPVGRRRRRVPAAQRNCSIATHSSGCWKDDTLTPGHG